MLTNYFSNRPKDVTAGLLLSSLLHNGAINCCQFANVPENRLIVSCGADHLVKVYLCCFYEISFILLTLSYVFDIINALDNLTTEAVMHIFINV